MPHYTISEKGKTAILVHEAPLDEKTKEIRKMFDVDEASGYPKAYNWRPLARLGPEYRPEKIFEVVEPYKEEQLISTKILLVSSMAFVTGLAHVVIQRLQARPWWAKPMKSLVAFTASSATLLVYFDYKQKRDRLKQAIYTDYMQKHPERFGTIHRPKFREVLFEYTPCRWKVLPTDRLYSCYDLDVTKSNKYFSGVRVSNFAPDLRVQHTPISPFSLEQKFHTHSHARELWIVLSAERELQPQPKFLGWRPSPSPKFLSWSAVAAAQEPGWSSAASSSASTCCGCW